EQGRPVAVAEVDGELDPLRRQRLADARDQRPVLLVDGALAAEVVIVLGDALQPLARDAAPARDVLQEGKDVFGALRAAERHEQERIVVGWLHLVRAITFGSSRAGIGAFL